MSPRRRPLIIALAALVIAWVIALGGFTVARHFKVTPEKVRAYLRGVDFAKLSPEARRQALRTLATMLNALSPEDRRAARLDREFAAWFRRMDEAEKGEFLELTVPAGFNQMLLAFEKMPEDKRRKAIEDSLRRLRETQPQGDTDPSGNTGTIQAPEISTELRDKMVKLGVKTFLDQGSAETKAELQPVLEEMQRSMESGRLFRSRRPQRGE
ncbi:MAG: hypothetical protein EXS36_02790 [Pedosphaera sp.]|nr:hypothetical protein [Pedosphaera sp.]